jgi:hypothetical protein
MLSMDGKTTDDEVALEDNGPCEIVFDAGDDVDEDLSGCDEDEMDHPST